MKGDINTVKYTIQYPHSIAERFEKEFLEKLDKFIMDETSGWLSMRWKKEYEEKMRWYE